LFAQLFVPRCTPHLSHLSETEAGSLNGVCYMWWDRFPCLALAGDPNLPRMQEAALRTMARILGLKSLARQESALHGLAHWHGQHDREVSAIIGGFSRGQPGPRPAPRQLREGGSMWLRAALSSAARSGGCDAGSNAPRGSGARGKARSLKSTTPPERNMITRRRRYFHGRAQIPSTWSASPRGGAGSGPLRVNRCGSQNLS
jgi:hypothetical protein